MVNKNEWTPPLAVQSHNRCIQLIEISLFFLTLIPLHLCDMRGIHDIRDKQSRARSYLAWALNVP